MRVLLAGQLWIGNAHDIRPLGVEALSEVSAVVDLATDEAPAQLPREIIYLRVPLQDSGNNLDATLVLAINSVATLLRSATPTLVCCSAGMSRSPAIACAALAIVRQGEADRVLTETLHDVPHDISPALWNCVRAVVEASH